MSIILSLDVGTGSLKAGLLETGNGQWLACASRPITTDLHEDRAEQDARQYWGLTEAIMLELRAGASDALAKVKAIGVTGQMRSVVLVGHDHDPIGPCLTLYDRRAHREYEEFVATFGLAAIYNITGQRLDAASTPAKLRWLDRHEPQRLRMTWKILAPKDYLRLRLTGQAATDPTDAGGWLLYDPFNECWNRQLVSFCNLSSALLPEVAPACSSAGTLRPDLAERWGMPEDVIVAIGGGDDIAATGCGATEVGDVYEHIGSTGSIFVVSDRPIPDPLHIVECYPTETKGRYWIGGSCNSAGSAIRHALHMSSFAQEDEIDWAGVEAALSRWNTKPASERPLYLPYIAGERCPIWNSSVREAWLDLGPAFTPEDWVISAHEGPALVLAWILQEVERLGVPLGKVYSAGKGGESESFGRFRATLYGRPVHRLDQPDAALFASALLAAAAAGEKGSVRERLRKLSKTAWVAHPDPQQRCACQDRLMTFQQRSRDLIAHEPERAPERAT